MRSIDLDTYDSWAQWPRRRLYLLDQDLLPTLVHLPRTSFTVTRYGQRTVAKFGPIHRPTLTLTSTNSDVMVIVRRIVAEEGEILP